MVTIKEVIKLWNKANNWDVSGFNQTLEELTKFANEVAAAEREACARVCEEMQRKGYWITKEEAAAAIRARREQ